MTYSDILNDISDEKSLEYRQADETTMKNATPEYLGTIKKMYSLFISEELQQKYQARVYSHTEQEKLQDLELAEQMLCFGYWLKNRYTKYYGPRWGYLSTLFHRELSNLMHIDDIKQGKKPPSTIDSIFQFDNTIRIDHTDKIPPTIL